MPPPYPYLDFTTLLLWVAVLAVGAWAFGLFGSGSPAKTKARQAFDLLNEAGRDRSAETFVDLIAHQKTRENVHSIAAAFSSFFGGAAPAPAPVETAIDATAPAPAPRRRGARKSAATPAAGVAPAPAAKPAARRGKAKP